MQERDSAGEDREHRLLTKLYGPDPAQGKEKRADEPEEPVIVDIEDMAFFGIPGDGRK